MSTPRTPKPGRYRRSARDRNVLCWCLDCLASGVAAAFLVLISLPGLLAVTQPLETLSTTVLVFVFLFAWFGLWVIIGSLRERAAAVVERS